MLSWPTCILRLSVSTAKLTKSWLSKRLSLLRKQDKWKCKVSTSSPKYWTTIEADTTGEPEANRWRGLDFLMCRQNNLLLEQDRQVLWVSVVWKSAIYFIMHETKVTRGNHGQHFHSRPVWGQWLRPRICKTIFGATGTILSAVGLTYLGSAVACTCTTHRIFLSIWPAVVRIAPGMAQFTQFTDWGWKASKQLWCHLFPDTARSQYLVRNRCLDQNPWGRANWEIWTKMQVW